MLEKVDMGRFSYKKVRKHVTQMDKKEKNRLREMFANVKHWEIIDHVNERISEKGYTITTDDLHQVIKNGTIVEYEQKMYLEDRKTVHLVVLNTVRKKEKEKDRLHVVFDISAEKIITLWINEYEDKHKTLDMGIYSKGLKVGENYWQE